MVKCFLGEKKQNKLKKKSWKKPNKYMNLKDFGFKVVQAAFCCCRCCYILDGIVKYSLPMLRTGCDLGV